jgi:hypothetical protein
MCPFRFINVFPYMDIALTQIYFSLHNHDYTILPLCVFFNMSTYFHICMLLLLKSISFYVYMSFNKYCLHLLLPSNYFVGADYISLTDTCELTYFK